MKQFISTVLTRSMMTAMAITVMAVPSAHAADANLTGFQKTQIETVVHDYLMKNPQVLVDALESFQSQQHDAANSKFKDKLGSYKAFLNDKAAPFAGNPKGDVTVVEFFDYNCGYCKHAVEDVTKLIDQDKNVKVIFKDFPILSESSGVAAQYALAAQKQGKYFEFHQKLMSYPGEKNETAYRSIAKDLGLDFDKLKTDAESKAVKDEIGKNIAVAKELGINGTPAFIFGDAMVPGYIGVNDMKDMVAQARKQKG